MARRYEIDELLWLRSSPLVAKPPGLPPLEEWMYVNSPSLPLFSSAGVPHFHIMTDHASPIGLTLTQPHNENNRPVTQTTRPKRLQPEDLAFSRLAISPEIQVSSSLLGDLRLSFRSGLR